MAGGLKGLAALMVLALVVSIPPLLGVAVHSETYSVPPLYTLYWVFEPEKGFITDYAWSPGGDKMALLVKNIKRDLFEKILVLDPDGRLIWESDKLNGISTLGVYWSPDGGMIATNFLKGGLFGPEELLIINVEDGSIVESKIEDINDISWSPSRNLIALATNNGVLLVDSSGNTVWRAKTGSASKVVWSHKGTMIAVASAVGGKVTVLNDEGDILWSKKVSKTLIRELAWDPRDEYLAVWVEEEGLHIFDKEGNLIWSVEEPFFDFQWSPNSQELAVAGVNLTLYDVSGKKLWSTSWAKGVISIIPKYTIDWNPAKNQIIAYIQDTLYIINSKNGEVVWGDKLAETNVKKISWSPRGDRLALLIGGKHGRILVFGPAKGYSTMELQGCHTTCKVIVSDGRIAKTYQGDKSGVIKLYATPGNYTLTFKIILIPEGVFIGDPLLLDKFNKTIAVAIKGGEAEKIRAPIDELVNEITRGLAQITFKGEPGTEIMIDGKHSVRIGDNGYINVYLEPGVHNIKYKNTLKEAK